MHLSKPRVQVPVPISGGVGDCQGGNKTRVGRNVCTYHVKLLVSGLFGGDNMLSTRSLVAFG